MSTDLDKRAVELLEKRRGDWQAVAEGSDISYSWLSKFMNNRIDNPGHTTLKKLVAYLERTAEQAKTPRASDLAHDLVQHEMDTITCPTSRPICADSARPTKPKSERR